MSTAGASPFQYTDRLRLLRQQIRLSRDADVIHVHDVYHPSSVLASCLARLLRKPLFATQNVGIVEHDMLAVRLAQRIVYATVGSSSGVGRQR